MNGDNEMNAEKKELIKSFKVVVEDLLDHYEEYTEAEKAQVREVFQKVAELNAVLDKYDVDMKFGWQDYFNALGKCFDSYHY